MCGRFALYLQAGAFADIFGCPPPDALPPHYNVVPDGGIVAVRAAAGGRTAGRLRWGLLPPWAKTAKERGRQINARFESVLEKPFFKAAARRDRCLIPASGFFEWQRAGSTSQPFFVHRADGAPVAMAGIWRRSVFGDEVVESCAILTMDAYPSIAGIHHRMPVMLDPAAWAAWLAPEEFDAKRLQAALRPLPEAALAAHPVSRAVNSPANDGPRLVERADQPAEPVQGVLF